MPTHASPILHIATYQMATYYDGSQVAVCFTSAESLWSAIYFLSSIMVFFLLPLIILVVLYAVIARQLLSRSPAFQRPTIIPIPSTITTDEISTTITPHKKQQPKTNGQLRNSVHKYRKQVIFMLITVVSSFFICLLPFRAFTFWIIIMPPETIMSLGIEGYYNILYFCRIMLYLNSALNPILYNLMSSKFRKGFYQLIASCFRHDSKAGMNYRHGRARNYHPERLPKVGNKRHSRMFNLTREGTIFTNSITTSTSSTQRTYLRNSSISASAGSGDGTFIDTAIGSAAAIFATISTAPITGIAITLPHSNESEKSHRAANSVMYGIRKELNNKELAMTPGRLVTKTCAMSYLIHRTIIEDPIQSEKRTN